ncbi:MAG: hypothetical protein HRU00_14195 [Myxococcales bacterium]|nr:hypothetical protein [Myxococcales bacterium]
MITRRSLLGMKGEWLVEIFISGSPFRFGTAPVDVTTTAGDVVRFFEGLDEQTLSASSEGSPDFSIAVAIDAGEEWGKIIGRAGVIERAPATLRRYFDGQILEESRLVLEGTVENFAYGEANERIQFDIVRRARTASRMLPSPGMVVDDTTWPVQPLWQFDEKIVGSFYPIIIGEPGSGSTTKAATEALLVETRTAFSDERLLIAGHKVSAAAVTIFDYTDEGTPPSASISVSTQKDKVGREISYCQMSGSGITVDPGRVYYVGWPSQGGGLLNANGAGALRGAGDVIAWIVQTWTDIPIDGARFAGVRELLNAYKIDTYINEPVDPMAWLNAEVFPLLPVEPRQGEAGIYWYMRRWSATASDAIARLDADAEQIQRESLITTQSSQVVNEVAVAYGPDRSTGRHNFRVILGAELRTRPNDEIEAGLVTTDDRMIGGYRAALSQSIYGRQPLELAADAVWDPATAVLIAQDIIAAQALPRRYVEYSGGSDLESFEIGDVIVLNDSSVQLLDVVAQVLDVTFGGADVVLSLELFDDPVVSDRLAS